MNKKMKLFADCKCELSESPMWNKKESKLYWRGFHGEIYRKGIDDDVNNFECFQLDIGNIGSMVFTDNDYMLLFGENGCIWKWKPNSTPVIYRNFNKSLFNDVITDNYGRIYCGMLAENYFDAAKRGEHGSLWLFDNNNFVCLENKVGTTPNGIRFSPDHKKLYFAVTDENCIYEYDFNTNTGELSNKKIFAKGCCPDGITVDSKGNLWVANCCPSEPLLCYSKNGEIIDKIYFDTYRIISVAFGGENNDLLFVTTACQNEQSDGKNGGVFVVEKVGTGAQEYIFHIEKECR